MHIAGPHCFWIMDYQQLLSTMEQVVNDPPSRVAFRLKHQRLIELAALIAKEGPKAKPLPTTSQMVALQVSLFDNWPGGIQPKRTPHRFKLQFKAWDGDPTRVNIGIDDPCFHGDSELLTASELIEKAHALNNNLPSLNPKRKKTLVKNPISDDYSAMMLDLAAEYPDSLFCLVRSKVHGEGTTYHHGQIARVVMQDGAIVEGELYLTTERIDLPAFVTTTAGKKRPLKRPVVAQSRFTPHDRHAGWRS